MRIKPILSCLALFFTVKKGVYGLDSALYDPNFPYSLPDSGSSNNAQKSNPPKP